MVMQLEYIHSFLVRPGYNVNPQPAISGTLVSRNGGLFDMLMDLFQRAFRECNIEVIFAPDENGQQNNESRDLLIEYARNPSIHTGRPIAESLQKVTTNRSGLGLLFLMKGIDNENGHILVISRFPAGSGVTATENIQDLDVEFLEQVFLKNAKAYKSAFFRTEHLDAEFQEGRAIDRQSTGPDALRDYWIKDFLKCQLRTTAAAGTRRLAEAVRNAVRVEDDPNVKQELVATATLLRGQAGRTRSTEAILENLGISDESTRAIRQHFPKPELMADTFTFDVTEFETHIGYRTVELDNLPNRDRNPT